MRLAATLVCVALASPGCAAKTAAVKTDPDTGEIEIAEPEPNTQPTTRRSSDGSASGGPMDAARLLQLAHSMADADFETKAEARSLQFSYRGVMMLLVVDETADRMRLVAPIMQAKELGRGELHILMQANFHTALDARYAISDGVVYSVYIHPLSPMRQAQVRSAIEQVASLVSTFGSSFSSTDVAFGG